MKKETFREARERLLGEFDEAGWQVVTHQGARALKTPYAVSRFDRVRLLFHPQAVYYEYGHRGVRGVTWPSDARSLESDIRGKSVADLLAALAKVSE